MECSPGLSELTGLAGFDGLGEDGITIIVVEHHDIIVATRRLDGEFSGLVRVGFVEVGCAEHRCKHGLMSSEILRGKTLASSLVERIFFCCIWRCPLLVARALGRCLEMSEGVRPGQDS